jgi:hypothetical protein
MGNRSLAAVQLHPWAKLHEEHALLILRQTKHVPAEAPTPYHT